MTSAVVVTALALAVLGAVALVIHVNSDAYAEAAAERYSDGCCFVCRRPLAVGDDIGSYLDDPTLGLAHFACLEALSGPLAEVG